MGHLHGLYFSEWLNKKGYSPQLLKKYKLQDGLSHLQLVLCIIQGVELRAIPSLAIYNEQLDQQFRIAAHSALDLAGFNHYVPMGKPLLMVAHQNQRVPAWMKLDVFDRTF